MPTRSRRLLVLPFLLLVPLGVARWRADHPPLSKMDREFQKALAGAAWVRIDGAGTTWGRLVNHDQNLCFRIQDKALQNQLAQTLRCVESQEAGKLGKLDTLIGIDLPDARHPSLTAVTSFTYSRREKGISLDSDVFDGESDFHFALVRPRFAPRFEAMIAELAARAKAPGSHPEIVLDHPP